MYTYKPTERDWCRECCRIVRGKTLAYSIKIYGRPICFDCQKGRLFINKNGTAYEKKPKKLSERTNEQDLYHLRTNTQIKDLL